MSNLTVNQKSYIDLNAELNLYDDNGRLQLHKDAEAVRQYFLQHVNQNTVFFHDLKEKLDYLIDNNYYEADFLELYDYEFVKSLFKSVYGHKFRFSSFMGAFKYYTNYTLKTFDGKRYLERFEDRVAICALFLAQGNEQFAMDLATEMINSRYQPATPTFLNSGKKQRGELVSCFLLNVSDDMNHIARAFNDALQLSKRGGGVAFCLTNIREAGAPIKLVENQASGIVPVMKIFENCFGYANQLGQRDGSGAVYLSVHHMDFENFIDTKRENADDAVRIKNLSLGIVVTDIAMKLASEGKSMYQFSAYDIFNEYKIAMSDFDIDTNYQELVNNPRIKKKLVNVEELMHRWAKLQPESGYPYILFQGNANKANPNNGFINMSNLCVAGSTEMLTARGPITAKELYDTQEDITALVDLRARDMDIEKYGLAHEPSTKMHKTAQNAKVFTIETFEGFEIPATEWHKFYVVRKNKYMKIPLNEVLIGDELLIQSEKGAFGSIHEPHLAKIVGALLADGTVVRDNDEITSVKLYLYGDEKCLASHYEDLLSLVLDGREDLVLKQSTTTPKFNPSASSDRLELNSAPLAKLLKEKGMDLNDKLRIPRFILQGDEQTQREFLSGLFQLDGCVTGNRNSFSLSIELGTASRSFAKQVQRMLINHGIYSRIYMSRPAGLNWMPDGKGGEKQYFTKEICSLRVTDYNSQVALYVIVHWLPKHCEKWSELTCDRFHKPYKPTHQYRARVMAINFIGHEDVYDVTVENGNSVIFNGIVTGNCSEIIQQNKPSVLDKDLGFIEVGQDISCNLGSLNLARLVDNGANLGHTVHVAMRALTAVSDLSSLDCSPTIAKGNRMNHSVGLGVMNMHGMLARDLIEYGSIESIDITDVLMATINYHSLTASMLIAKERGETYSGFHESTYVNGQYFNEYLNKPPKPRTERAKEFFDKYDIAVPTGDDWAYLKSMVMEHGLYNQYRMAVAPTGSISYINHSTSSLHPITKLIEVRKEGKTGRKYYPAPYLNEETMPYYKSAYNIDPYRIIDVYAAATRHVDQGLSLTMFLKADVTTKDIIKLQLYAWRRGIKTIYYVRIEQDALEGTEVQGCVSCAV